MTRLLVAFVFAALLASSVHAAQLTRPYGMTVIPQLPAVPGAAPTTNTITTGGTAQTLFSGVQITIGCWVQNPANATETLYVDLIGTAGPSSPSSIAVAPGGYYKCDFIPLNGISVEAATTGHAFTAAAW